jgi:hypothetical protein
MKTYKVIALSVGASGNKIFHSGDTVPENAWPRGTAAELVAKGFLREITDEVAPAPPALTPEQPPASPVEAPAAPELTPPANEPGEAGKQDDAADDANKHGDDAIAPEINFPSPAEKKAIEDIKLSELKEYLSTNNVEHDPMAGKPKLYELYKNHIPS